MNKLSFITLTNDGYFDYTENCIKSLEISSFDVSSITGGAIKVYSIGEKAKKLEEIFPGKVKVEKLESCDITTFENYKSSSNYANIVQKKFEIITKEFEDNDFVCFFDGDIVFEHPDFLKVAFDEFSKNPNLELVIQDDNNEARNWHVLVCSGFMIIKKTHKMKEMFHPDATKKYETDKDWGDQDYINEKVIPLIEYKVLPRETFPNGDAYYHNNTTICPMMIHFNWVVGHEKKNRMVKYNKWYL